MNRKRIYDIALVVLVAAIIVLAFFAFRKGPAENTPASTGTAQKPAPASTGKDSEEWKRLSMEEIAQVSAVVTGSVFRRDTGEPEAGVSVSWEAP